MRFSVYILEKDGFCGVSFSTPECATLAGALDAIDALRQTFPKNNVCAQTVLDRSHSYFYEFDFGPRLYWPAWQS